MADKVLTDYIWQKGVENIMKESEDKVLEASVLLERARVLSAILTRQYFGQDIATPADLWKISGYFFEDAKVVAETITDMVGDAEKLLNEAV